ncbi:MAG: PqqD family protein [Planctomycetota bacterium]|jgi:hypothetical protein
MGDLYYRHSENTASRLVDGEMVIVTLPEGEMTILNPCGSAIWSALNGETTVATITASLAAQFNLASPPVLDTFLRHLLEKKLIEGGEQPHPATQPIPPAPTIAEWEEPAVRAQEVLEALAGFCGSAFDGVDPCRIDDITCDAVFD